MNTNPTLGVGPNVDKSIKLYHLLSLRAWVHEPVSRAGAAHGSRLSAEPEAWRSLGRTRERYGVSRVSAVVR